MVFGSLARFCPTDSLHCGACSADAGGSVEGCRGSQGGVGIIALAWVFLVFLCVSDRSPLCEAGAGWGCDPVAVLACCPLLSAVLGVRSPVLE